MQEDDKFRLCDYRDGTVNQIISEYNKRAQKEYKTRHNLAANVIYWELCKILKFDHTDKWYIYTNQNLSQKMKSI